FPACIRAVAGLGEQFRRRSKMTEADKSGTRDRTDRVAFDLTPPMAQEVDRIIKMTDLGSRPEVFRRAFTLLRIHIDAAVNGRVVYMVDAERPNDKYIITLPFNVRHGGSSSELP